MAAKLVATLLSVLVYSCVGAFVGGRAYRFWLDRDDSDADAKVGGAICGLFWPIVLLVLAGYYCRRPYIYLVHLGARKRPQLPTAKVIR